MRVFQQALALSAAVTVIAAFAGAQNDGSRQQPNQEQLQKYEQLRDEKLAKDVFEKAPWVVQDFDKARQQAKESGKPIFAYFTRSYAN